MNDDERRPPEHPELGDEEHKEQRGEEPRDPVGHTPDRPADPDPDPGYVPDPGRGDRWREMAGEIGRERRPRRADVYPYLLVRAFSPGDRGQRPVWPPVVCWESPDLLLIDAAYTGPFDQGRLVVSPVAGRTYRVFVRVWNLGLLPAVGVHVQAWAVAAGFFGTGNQNDPYYQQHHIGGAWIPELADRRDPGCVRLVELDAPWRIDPGETGHECLIASVSCPADHFAGPLLVNEHRHVGQRNLTIVGPGQSAAPLITTLAGLVPKGFTLELTHGGPAAVPLLQALSGGFLPIGEKRRPRPIVAPALEEIRGGVDIGASVHLLTAFESEGRTVVARSDALAKVVGRTRYALRSAPREGPAVHPFAEPGGTRRLLDTLGPERWGDVGEVTDEPLAYAWVRGLEQLLDARELPGSEMARALGGPDGAQHLLRLTLTSPEGELVGGYSIVVAG
ncbi:hypothetical protein [Cellulomonas sp. KRMCY2]|uniref:hypothetical protein n=1 Tax=Cellulomonas sp. KRMCY2 TaxID=1304865 RepID=UPI00045E7083|nr:hypothetical protein [Cellulomonas sp. KRMCY2]